MLPELFPFFSRKSVVDNCYFEFWREKIYSVPHKNEIKTKILSSTQLDQSKSKGEDPIFLSFLRSSNWIYTWNKLLICGDVFAIEELLWQVETWLGPLDVKIQRESDAVVLVIYLQHVGDLDSWNSKATNVKFLKPSALPSRRVRYFLLIFWFRKKSVSILKIADASGNLKKPLKALCKILQKKKPSSKLDLRIQKIFKKVTKVCLHFKLSSTDSPSTWRFRWVRWVNFFLPVIKWREKFTNFSQKNWTKKSPIFF